MDRDMFMCFRGGGIGHKVTREWDEFLQHKGCDLPLDDEDIDNDLGSENSGDEPEEEIKIGKGDGADEAERDEIMNSKSDESEGKEDNVIIADEGEELDEEIWAQEGYGSL